MNICSNQIKEVILHRFKVNSLQKLLIHINFLLAFSVLFCSHSAFGQRVYIDESSSSFYGADRRAVDLGLNVYWADRNVGASSLGGYGNHFTWNAASKWSDPAWQYWRTPTNQEFTDLTTYTNVSVKNHICTFVKSNDPTISIILQPAGYKNPGSNTIVSQGIRGRGYYWASDSPPRILDPTDKYGYRFQFAKNTWDLDYWDRDYQFSIRPVIDKDTIIVTTAGGNTITKTYPRGTKIKIGAFMDECHKVAYWTKSSISESGTITPNNTSGDNGDIEIIITENVTYTAIFSIKTTNIRATTDSSKGWVGLNVWK